MYAIRHSVGICLVHGVLWAFWSINWGIHMRYTSNVPEKRYVYSLLAFIPMENLNFNCEQALIIASGHCYWLLQACPSRRTYILATFVHSLKTYFTLKYIIPCLY